MKRIAFLLAAVLLSLNICGKAAGNAGGGVFDAGIGIGVYDKGEGTGAMFTQRAGAQWKVADINSKLSVTAGAYLVNAYGSSSQVIEIPWMDKEIDEFDIKMTREDISILPTASLNYSFTPTVEAYFSLGFGVGILHAKSSVNWDGEDPDEYDSEGISDSATKVCFAMSTYVGVRYYLNSSWAVNAQFGMIAGNIKSHAGSYDLLSAGVSYRF